MITKVRDEKFGSEKPRNRGDREIGGREIGGSDCIRLPSAAAHLSDLLIIIGSYCVLICLGHRFILHCNY